MRNVETVELGEEALAYVRAHLSDANVLCAALRGAVDEHDGDVFTMVPPGTSRHRLRQFNAGGLLEENRGRFGAISLPDGSTLVPVANLHDEKIALLRQTMANAPASICIVDDFNPRWSEHAPSYFGPTGFGVGDEVYHLVRSDQGELALDQALSAGSLCWHGVAAVCQATITPDGSHTVSPSELQRAAASVLLITCVAYDGEGFVGWRRRLP